MNYEESLEKLFTLHQFGIKLGLENINKLLAHIGNPEKELKAIHVAGSNGKGSTSSFIASILTESGFKVGLYTSPHFINFNERIRINGVEIPNDFVTSFMNKNNEFITRESPTFFELTTAMAFKYFAEHGVDYAVIETGLGGRLDATNVLQSLASVITSISLEHTNILGTTIEEIAYEKGEIIKPNQQVFIGSIPDSAKEVIIKKANKENCKYYELNSYADFSTSGSKVRLKGETIEINKLPLKGKYQFKNASLAVLTISKLFQNISKSIIFKGLDNVITNTGIQGRYETYNNSPKVIFDSAHNLEGIEIFIEEFLTERQNYSKCRLIYGAMNDKNVKEIIKKLSLHFELIYATEIDYERAFTIEEIIKIGESLDIKIEPLKKPAEYINQFIERNQDEVLVVLGSMYILGEIKRNLLT